MESLNGYSASVALSVIVDGTTLSLSHVGPSTFIVRDQCDPIPAGDAELIVSVDGRERKTPVFLPHGITGPRVRVAYF